jgi:uncharacterized protein YjbI with pentapeptide repeats
MHITKPDNLLFLQGYEKRGDQCYLIATVGLVVDSDGALLSEKDAWQWLAPQFPDEPFDLGLQKRRGTFAVAGTAYAPRGQAATRMAVRVRVGDLEKTLHVHGDRQWREGLTGWSITQPAPFTQMPIQLARAFGGPEHPANPYGTGLPPAGQSLAGIALANIELPDAPVQSRHDRPAVATFGNLPITHPSIAAWVGTVDAAWENTRFPWLPDNVDPRYFDRVPQDQCASTYWDGTEQWSVQGMHPEQAVIQGRMPGLQPQLLWMRGAASPWHDLGQPELCRAVLKLDTLWLFPESGRQVLLYRAALPVQREDGADIEALWIDVLPAGVQPPELASQVAQWSAQTPRLAARLNAAGGATSAAVASSLRAAPLATEQASTPISNPGEAVANATASLADTSAILPESPSAGPATPAGPAQPGADLAPQAASNSTFQAAVASTEISWDDALWQEICDEYGQAWSDARDMVREMEQEQAEYGVTFPEVPPFVAPPKPVATAVPLALPTDFGEHLARQVDQGMAEGERMFEAVLRDNYPDDPDRVAALMAYARSGGSEPITQTEVEEVLSNLPPELRARADAQIRAMSADFEALNQRLRETFGAASAGQSAMASSAAGSNGTMSTAALSNAMASTGAVSTAAASATAPAMALQHANPGVSMSERNAPGQGLQNPVADMRGQTLEKQTYRDANLRGADFTDTALDECDFTGADLTDASFDGASIRSCTFNGALMQGASMNNMDARDTNFSQAVWRGAQAQRISLAQCDLTGIDATQANLSGGQLEQCTLDQACLTQATLSATTFSGVRAAQADFSHVQAEGMRIDSDTTLAQANFEHAHLAKCSFMHSHFGGSVWRDAEVSDGLILACDLRDTQAQRLRARRAVFKDSRIQDADWRQADLMQASFDYAVIERVDASGSNWHGTQTRTATIRSMRLQDSLLSASRLLQEHAYE